MAYRRRACLTLAVLCLHLASSVGAREIFADPRGKTKGKGTRESPLSLAAALGKKSPAQPCDTVLLLSGVYQSGYELADRLRAAFAFTVSGTEAKPIRVRPAPGANVVLNGPVDITGAFTHYIDLDIGDLRWTPRKGSLTNRPCRYNARMISTSSINGISGKPPIFLKVARRINCT